MTLIKTISGFRGTIGGPTGDTLNPLDIVKFVTAYAMQRREAGPKGNLIVVGRMRVFQDTWYVRLSVELFARLASMF